jgi:hypothetical protein
MIYSKTKSPAISKMRPTSKRASSRTTTGPRNTATYYSCYNPSPGTSRISAD